MCGSPPEGTEVIWSMYRVSMCASLNAAKSTYEHFGNLMFVNDEQSLNVYLPTNEQFGKLILVNE